MWRGGECKPAIYYEQSNVEASVRAHAVRSLSTFSMAPVLGKTSLDASFAYGDKPMCWDPKTHAWYLAKVIDVSSDKMQVRRGSAGWQAVTRHELPREHHR